MISATRRAWPVLILAVLLATGCGEPEERPEGHVRFAERKARASWTLTDDRIVLGEKVEFPGVDGKPITPRPGVYRVAPRGENRLELSLGRGRKPLELLATRTSLPLTEEQSGTLESPRALLRREMETPSRTLWLLMPDGTTYRCAGTLANERARGVLTTEIAERSPAELLRSFRSVYQLPGGVPAELTAPAPDELYWNRLEPLEVSWSPSGGGHRVDLVQTAIERPVATRWSYSDHVAISDLHHLDPGQYAVVLTDSSGATSVRNIRVVGRHRSISAYDHNLAIGPDSSQTTDADDYVWAWGRNDYLQCAREGVEVAPLDQSTGFRARAVAAGWGHSVAIHVTGGVYAWGENFSGQLGRPQGGQRAAPVGVLELPEGVVEIAAGGVYSLALCEDGTVWSWGSNVRSQCGQGNDSPDCCRPGQVLAYATDRSSNEEQPLTGVVAIAAGCMHALALKADGTLWGWGWNDAGQLDVTIGPGDERSHAVRLWKDWDDVAFRAVAAVGKASLVLAELPGGELRWYGWGDDWFDWPKLDDPPQTPREVGACPTTDNYVLGTGYWHLLLLHPTGGSFEETDLHPAGTLWMRGKNGRHLLGAEEGLLWTWCTTPGANLVAAVGGRFHSVAVGWEFGFVDQPVLYLWGSNDYGQLGDPTHERSESVEPVTKYFQ